MLELVNLLFGDAKKADTTDTTDTQLPKSMIVNGKVCVRLRFETGTHPNVFQFAQ